MHIGRRHPQHRHPFEPVRPSRQHPVQRRCSRLLIADSPLGAPHRAALSSAAPSRTSSAYAGISEDAAMSATRYALFYRVRIRPDSGDPALRRIVFGRDSQWQEWGTEVYN